MRFTRKAATLSTRKLPYHPSRSSQWFKRAFGLVQETFEEYSRDRGDMVAAALAFYTLLSIAPLIIIAVAIAGAVLGRGAAEHEALRVLGQTMSPQAASAVRGWVEEASAASGAASIVGFVLLLYTASRLTAQLRIALNQVWNVDEFQADNFKASLRDYLRRRLFALLLVIAAGPLLLVVFASRTLLSGLYGALFAGAPAAGRLVQVAQLSFSFVLVTLISAVVFKIVPDTHISWRAVRWGAVLTSVLFNAGNWLVGLYLGHAAVAQTYGAAGSVVVVLLWLYFSAQMFVAGAEFTQVYSAHWCRGLPPDQRHAPSRQHASLPSPTPASRP
jgi:membrane protein